MQKQIENLRASRQNVLSILNRMPDEQLNAIPPKFNNNIIWNAGHLVATQQLLCHKLAGLPMVVPEGFINAYRKGTKPEGVVDATGIAYIKDMLELAVDITEKVIQENPTVDFTPYPTSFGITLASFEDAIGFNNIHEGLHLGYMMALSRLV